MILKNEPNVDFEDADVLNQIKNVKKHLHTIMSQESARKNSKYSQYQRLVSQDGLSSDEALKKLKLKNIPKTPNELTKTFAESLSVFNKPDSDPVTDQYYREYKSQLNKLYSAFGSDNSWSDKTEVNPEHKDSGHFNRVLDLFTSLQVSRLESGDHGSKGGGAWGFEDHHIFGKGDNQANTHFALVFQPLHQNGLHSTNYLIEDFTNVQENLKMQKEIMKNYDHETVAEQFKMTQDELDEFNMFFNEDGSINLEFLKTFYYVNKDGNPTSLKPGSTIPAITIVPTDVGNVGNRDELEMRDHHGVFMYPPMKKDVVQRGGHYDNSISHSYVESETSTRSTDNLQVISSWSNDNLPEGVVSLNPRGSILDEFRSFTTEEEIKSMFNNEAGEIGRIQRSLLAMLKEQKENNPEDPVLRIPPYSEFYFIAMNDKNESEMGKPGKRKKKDETI